MSQYIASYDITVDRARGRVADVLLQYGDRIQESVFELCLDEGDMLELMLLVGAQLSTNDRFDLIPIDVHAGRKRLSWGAGDPSSPLIIE